MMAERPKHQVAFQFKNVQLFKDQSLGIGSYGAVCKAKCDDLLCAAKIIHPTLFDPTALNQIAPQREHRLPIRRFEQECEFMSAIRHPNIVQYLGMFRDTADTHLPVLLMELMDDSLTHFLESATHPIPYHIQVNICHDITLALSFLHSNNIVHRDLSSNNVLLRGNVLAKVTDFGMARLGDINPQATRFTDTMCPGTDVYMPPEAVQDKPVYTEKIDCFSFGVITVQILTRQFPEPEDRLQEVEMHHPGLPKGKLLIQIPEIDRRQNHISQIPPNHSLLPIALECLKDKDNERPSAHQLCERTGGLKEMPNYIVSAQGEDEIIRSQAIRLKGNESRVSSKDEEIQQLRQLQQEKDQTIRQLEERERQMNQQLRQIQENNRQIQQGEDEIIRSQAIRLKGNESRVSSKDEEIQQLRQLQQEKDQTIRQLEERERQMNQQLRQIQENNRQIQQENRLALRVKTQQLQEREIRLGHVNRQLEASEQLVAQFERRIAELEQQLSRREQQKTRTSSGGKELTSIKLRWREGKRAPHVMERRCDAVVDGNTVYVRSGDSVEIYSYNVTSDSWSQVPNCVLDYGSMVIINGWLTTVGGSRHLSIYSNELFSLTGEGSGRRWTKTFPSMPTKRQWSTALCTGTTLIVAGGWGVGGALPTVELMNTTNHQWSTAADLPEPMYCASATVCTEDQIYMVGGIDGVHNYIRSVYTCSVNALLQSCIPKSRPLENKSQVDKPSMTLWKQLADLPVTRSVCQTFHNQLLAIGGVVGSGKITAEVYVYNSATNSWEIISHMRTGRYGCFTAILPDNQLMVVGGRGKVTDTVEFASAC